MSVNVDSPTAVKEAVRERYGLTACSDLGSHQEGTRRVAEAFGYSEAELASIPAEANMGVSCGNPTAMASLKSGEVVLDLGCGGGLDIFLAAQKVGLEGKAIGIDMTPAMIDRARRNAAKAGLTNVEFHLAEIENMPLPTASVNCVISNCVLNLVPEKSRAFAEIFRVLKPGGRLAISDIALKQALPPELAANFYAYVGCVAGAILIQAYVAALEKAGFEAVQVIDSGADLNAYAQVGQSGCCCGAPGDVDSLHQQLAELLQRFDVNKYAASVKVFALKPTCQK